MVHTKISADTKTKYYSQRKVDVKQGGHASRGGAECSLAVANSASARKWEELTGKISHLREYKYEVPPTSTPSMAPRPSPSAILFPPSGRQSTGDEGCKVSWTAVTIHFLVIDNRNGSRIAPTRITDLDDLLASASVASLQAQQGINAPATRICFRKTECPPVAS
ncbi:hypothetical protein EVAR_45442_1 [Eumeta japonica]|uniref:Uncharacterized protein n=1 Tax=Eumeta variegata TaxID=151549 RepID=A0A4C1YIZ5_EUMVA|nr:hypothetical protein EVAR_45442_1 [Eumeta japonica]